MFKVSVENFQSIANAELTVEGFTVVTGKNNSGKSALLRAVNSVFTNALGSSFVRNGEDYCQVEIGFDDSQVVKWRKGDKVKPTYWINNGDPIHSGRNAPKELEQFKVLPIKANGREIWPQIAPQFTGQVFLIDLPGSVMAEMVADVDRVSELNLALKNCEKDKRSNNSTLKIRNKDFETLKKEREKFADLEERIIEYGFLEERQTYLQDLYDKINKIVSLREKLNHYKNQIEKLSDVNTHLETIMDLTEKEDRILSLSSDISAYSKLSRGHRKHLKQKTLLVGVDSLGIPNTERIKSARAELKVLSPLLKRRNKSQETVSLLSNLSQIEIPDFSSECRDRLNSLLDIRKRIVQSKNSVYNHQVTISNVGDDLDKLNSDISQTLSEHGECPTCGSET